MTSKLAQNRPTSGPAGPLVRGVPPVDVRPLRYVAAMTKQALPSETGLRRPINRVARPFVGTDHNYVGASIEQSYLTHPDFATGRVQLARAFGVLERDLNELFDYIEPCEENSETYSHRTYAQLGRAAMEVEGLLSIGFRAAGENECRLSMKDYRRLNGVYRLSEYSIRVPVWDGHGAQFRPFERFTADEDPRPVWWDCYNFAKHNRVEKFHEATLSAAVQATGGALVCLFAQIAGLAFGASTDSLSQYSSSEGWIQGESLFEIRPPRWDEEEKYAFDKDQDHSKPLEMVLPELN